MHKLISIDQMLEYILDKTSFKGNLAVILGSGLGAFAHKLENSITIPYSDIPEYPQPTVEGHAGELVFGQINGIEILAAKGRFHFYEGHDFHTVTMPIHLFKKLGIKKLIITNAAGSMDRARLPGSLMAIAGHLDCTFRHGWKSPDIVKGLPYYNPRIIDLALKAGDLSGVKLTQGNYCWAMGPAYETPAEIKYFSSLGGNAVGMSTVPEILTGGELGLQVLGLSCLTNFAAGISEQPLSHAEVIETADRVGADFTKLLLQIISMWKD